MIFMCCADAGVGKGDATSGQQQMGTATPWQQQQTEAAADGYNNTMTDTPQALSSGCTVPYPAVELSDALVARLHPDVVVLEERHRVCETFASKAK